MAYLNTLYDDLETAVAGQWTDVVVAGVRYIYEAEHIESQQLENIPLPFAVIALSDAREADWGGVAQTYEVDVDLYYVGTVMGAPSTIRTRLETMRDYLWNNDPLAAGLHVREVSRVSWAASLPINALLRAKKLAVLAGVVSATLVIGEAPAG